MALSDSCSDFLGTVREAANELAKSTHHYSHPDYPLRYGEEIEGLRRACAKVASSPYDPEAAAQLFRLTASVMMYLDTQPDDPALPQREAEVNALSVQVNSLTTILREASDSKEVAVVPSMVLNLVEDTQFTPVAVSRLKGILPKLGKASYDIAIKIISDIGSATVKKSLGL